VASFTQATELRKAKHRRSFILLAGWLSSWIVQVLTVAVFFDRQTGIPYNPNIKKSFFFKTFHPD
jgi:hypothetical protein